MQSGTTVVNPAYSNVYEVYFPVPFSSTPTVVCMNGDYAATLFTCHIVGRFSERYTVAVFDLNGGTSVSGIIRLDWIAHGPA